MTPRALAPLLVGLIGLIVLPLVLPRIGLTLTSATDCVIFAIVGLGLNLLLGTTRLVSFGHGAWLGLGAYGAAIFQLRFFPGAMLLPSLLAVAFLLVASFVFGFLFLRRRGVYFSLLTLALSALCYTIAFRSTWLTGGESGLGGVQRAAFLDAPGGYYICVALVGFMVLLFLWRVRLSPFGSVLMAIGENEQRAQFAGYDTRRYKLVAFIISATVTGGAGILLAFNHRFASADPLAVSFSGELVAMVIIGGTGQFMGPTLGALFYILFREFLSQWTENWLLWFGLLFVVFILFSPAGLIGVAARVLDLILPKRPTAAAMAARRIPVEGAPVPPFLAAAALGPTPALEARGVDKHFGGVAAVAGIDMTVKGRGVHALIGPNGAGKTTFFNLVSGMFAPSAGTIEFRGRHLEDVPPFAAAAAGLTRSFQITNLFKGLSVEENLRLAVQARHRERFAMLRGSHGIAAIAKETRALIDFLGLAGLEQARAEDLSYGGQRLLDMGIAVAGAPALLLLDEPLAGLAAAERDRIGKLVRRLGDEIGVLLIEHDIDRVFALSDHVTVMNEGALLIEGPPDVVRADPKVGDVYIGSGAAAIAARPRDEVAVGAPLLALDKVNGFYGKSHILNDVSFGIAEREVVAVLGRNGAGKSTLLKAIIGLVTPRPGSVRLDGEEIAGQPTEAIARRGIGYVAQGRRLFPGLSVHDNIELGRIRRGSGGGTHWDNERIFAFFPRLRERIEVAADLLSGGEQQMAAIARALAGHVRLLLLDEPFEGLSPAVTEEVFGAVDRLRREIAIIIVDHNLDLVLAVADRVVVLDRGRVVHQGPAKPLREDFELRRQVLWV